MSTENSDPRFANYQRPEALRDRLSSMRVYRGDGVELLGSVAIIVGRWHDYIVDRLLQGALDTLNEQGFDDERIDVIQAPGAYEMPLIAKALARKGYTAIITLGAVVKGETPHFEYVAGECARGLSQVSLDFDTPIGFGVLTVNDFDQALERAAEGEANKGREAVLAALESAGLLKQLS